MAKDQLLALTTEVDRLLAAGVPAAVASDSLRQRGRTLRELSQKVAALVPVADALDGFFLAAPEQAATRFLDLVTMSRQIRANLSGVGLTGDLEALPASGPWQTPAPASDILGLQEGLNRSGPRRGPLVQEALARLTSADLRVIAPLLRALEDKNATHAELVAEHAAPALGPAALPDLRRHLDLKGTAVAARRLHLLCRIDPVAGVEVCRQALWEGSPRVCLRAFPCLTGLVSAEEAEQAALVLLDHRNFEVQVMALAALRDSRRDVVLDRLLELARQETSAPLQLACRNLLIGLAHPQTTPRLLRWVEEERRSTRQAAQKRTGWIRFLLGIIAQRPEAGTEAVVRSVLPFLVDPEEQVRQEALQVLGGGTAVSGGHAGFAAVSAALDRVGSQGAGVVPDLLALLDNADSQVRHTVLAVLGGLGAVFAEVAPALWAAVHKEDKKGGPTLALRALRRLPPARRANWLPDLLKMVRSRIIDNAMWREIILMLPDHLDQERDTILHILRCALQDRDQWTHNTALEAITACGPAAREAAADVLAMMQWGIRYDAGFGKVLRAIDPDGEDALPTLLRLVRSGDPADRSNACEALAAYGTRAAAAIPDITALRDGDDYSLKVQAIATLNALEGKKR